MPPRGYRLQRARSPVRVLALQPKDQRADLFVGSPWARGGASVSVFQTFLPILTEAIDPLVCGLAVDAEPLGKLAHAVVGAELVRDELLLLFSHSNRLPWHGNHLLPTGSISHFLLKPVTRARVVPA